MPMSAGSAPKRSRNVRVISVIGGHGVRDVLDYNRGSERGGVCREMVPAQRVARNGGRDRVALEQIRRLETVSPGRATARITNSDVR
jgi:hypothetical protein